MGSHGGGRRAGKENTVRFRGDADYGKLKFPDLDSNSTPPSSQTAPQESGGDRTPDMSVTAQLPAAQRLRVNDQRIKLLTSINQVVQQRCDLESNRQNLVTLQDELKKKLKRKVEESHMEKKDKLRHLRLTNTRLESERSLIIQELDHLRRHLDREEAHHVTHARAAAANAIRNFNIPGASDHNSISSIPSTISRNVARSGPSRKADNKLAAARLMKEIAELRQYVDSIEMRLAAEMKRKKAVEQDIARLRRELSKTKSNVAALRMPLAPLQKKCTRFA